MARLDWQNVAVPQLSGISGVEAAQRMVGAGFSGLGNALGNFADQGVLRQLAQYNDANALHQDIQSGKFNLGNASAAALGDVMNRPAHLISNATYQERLNHDQVMNPVRQADAKFDMAQKVLNYTRAEQERARGIAMPEAVYQMGQQGEMTPEHLQQWVNSFTNPEDRLAALAQANKLIPGFGNPLVAPSQSAPPVLGGQPAGGNSSSGAATNTNFIPSSLVPVVEQAAAQYKIPTSYMTAMLKMEDGLTGKMSPTGAIGPGQFTQGTWNSLVNTPEGKALGMTEINNSNFRTANDPRWNQELNIKASALLASKNAEILTKQGLPVNEQNLYLLHNVGPGIIPALKGGSVSAETLDAMSKNGYKQGEPVQQWLDRHLAKFNQGLQPTNQQLQQNIVQQAQEAAIRNTAANTATTAGLMFNDAGTAHRMVNAFQQDPQGLATVEAVANRMVGSEGALTGYDKNDVIEAIKEVQSELGVSASIAAGLVEGNTREGTWNWAWGDERVIDFDALGDRLKAIKGNIRDKDGKPITDKTQRAAFITDALVQNQVVSENQASLGNVDQQMATIRAEVAALNSVPDSPAKQQRLLRLNQQAQALTQQQGQALQTTNGLLKQFGIANQPAQSGNVTSEAPRETPKQIAEKITVDSIKKMDRRQVQQILNNGSVIKHLSPMLHHELYKHLASS